MEPGDFDFERDNFPQLLENDMWELARSYARDYLSLVNDKQGGVDFLKSEKLELLKSDAYTFHVSQVEVWAVTLSTLKEDERVVSRYIESFDRGRNIESFLSFVPLLKSYVDGFAAQLKIEGLTRLIELEERPHTPTAKPGSAERPTQAQVALFYKTLQGKNFYPQLMEGGTTKSACKEIALRHSFSSWKNFYNQHRKQPMLDFSQMVDELSVSIVEQLVSEMGEQYKGKVLDALRIHLCRK